jgi:uncharacterized protein YbaR (Trm112 family)
MISEQLLKIIVCPVNHQPLRIADRRLLDQVNEGIRTGRVKDSAGRQVSAEIKEGLIRQDGQVMYPVRDDIPVLLADEGIRMDMVQ